MSDPKKGSEYFCDSEAKEGGNTWDCTKEKGHSGEHEATTVAGEAVARWDNDKEVWRKSR